VLRTKARKTFLCNACHHQTSLIAGTLLEGTKLPLTVWFLAIYLVSQAKTGLSALALKRALGVSYPTAWLIHHKLMQAMVEREDRPVRWLGQFRWRHRYRLWASTDGCGWVQTLGSALSFSG